MGIIWPYGKLLSNFLIQNKKMKLKGLRWWVIALICIATVINYIDRTAFGVMWPEMGKDLGMDEADYAVMLNVFMVTYALGKFLSGKLYDKIGTRLGFVFSIALWSAAAILHAFAKGLVSLSVVRAMLVWARPEIGQEQ